MKQKSKIIQWLVFSLLGIWGFVSFIFLAASANDVIVTIRHNPSQSISTACFTARFFHTLTDGF